jgi:hypothetical protein
MVQHEITPSHFGITNRPIRSVRRAQMAGLRCLWFGAAITHGVQIYISLCVTSSAILIFALLTQSSRGWSGKHVRFVPTFDVGGALHTCDVR